MTNVVKKMVKKLSVRQILRLSKFCSDRLSSPAGGVPDSKTAGYGLEDAIFELRGVSCACQMTAVGRRMLAKPQEF